MFRIASLTLFTLVAASLFSSQPAESAVTSAPAAAGNLVREPVVIFDVTGSALAGSIHTHLTVSNDGFATISKRNDNPFGNVDVDVQTASVGSESSFQLLVDLISAGAVVLPDQDISVADIPLTTITIAEGKELALSRTFSYWVGINQYSGVAAVMSDFVTTTFPNF